MSTGFEEATSAADSLAPPPDFRYVGLQAGPRARVGLWASLVAAGASVGTGALHGFGVRGAILTTITATAAALALRRVGGPKVGIADRKGGAAARGAVAMALVPWGILVDPDGTPRVLRWAGVKRVHVDMIYGSDQATPTTLWSVVTVETAREKLAARAPGAVSIDRLVAHVDAYAEEQAHAIALDMDGEVAADAALEPSVEPLLDAARAYLASADASLRLGLPAGGYRQASARAPTDAAVLELRAVLRDRSPRPVDPRAFAAVVAAELNAAPLAEDLVKLVASPHPVIAAVAKSAARALGVSTARVGSLGEVAPFLPERDVDALERWSSELEQTRART